MASRLVNELHVTEEEANMQECDHVLLYLTSQTWTRGKDSAALGDEVANAMRLDMHILLVHEMPGAGGQDARFGCEFSRFFAHPDGATPSELLASGIYSEIAVPLKGGPWREASMVLLDRVLHGSGLAADLKNSARRSSYRMSKRSATSSRQETRQRSERAVRNALARPALNNRKDSFIVSLPRCSELSVEQSTHVLRRVGTITDVSSARSEESSSAFFYWRSKFRNRRETATMAEASQSAVEWESEEQSSLPLPTKTTPEGQPHRPMEVSSSTRSNET